MVFKGWQKTSLIEYPDKISTVLFTGGCNFRCPFCYNSDLVLNPENIQDINEALVFEYLENKKGIYQAVVVSGGEPCMHKGLDDFFKRIKEIGLLTGLETNGSFPDRIHSLLRNKLIDYIAMDIKAPFNISKYAAAAGITDPLKSENIIIKIKQSVKLIEKSGIKYEFRTTFAPEIHNPEDADTIAESIKGNYVIQGFLSKETVMNNDLNNKHNDSYNQKILNNFSKIKEKYNNLSIRNL